MSDLSLNGMHNHLYLNYIMLSLVIHAGLKVASIAEKIHNAR